MKVLFVNEIDEGKTSEPHIFGLKIVYLRYLVNHWKFANYNRFLLLDTSWNTKDGNVLSLF